jgi:hypothetical protein
VLWVRNSLIVGMKIHYGTRKNAKGATHYGMVEVVTNENSPNYWSHWFE